MKGSTVTFIVVAVSLGAVLMAFTSNASPYVTMSQARASKNENVHIAGDLIKGSIVNDFRTHTLRFQMKDAEGTIVNVIHRGEMPANLAEATKIVAIGSVRGNDFISGQLLVKCPSKYEEQGKKAPTGSGVS